MGFREASTARLAWWAALLASIAVACGGERSPRQAILIVLDAARPDRFSAFGSGRATTPNMDRLADEGLRFHSHFSPYTTTFGAMPALFYSRYFAPPIFPASAEVPLTRPIDLFSTLDDEARSLPAILSGAGLRTHGISAHPWIRGGTRLADEFDSFRHVPPAPAPPGPEVASPMPFARAGPVVDRALDWLRDHSDEDYFLYLHFMDTHFPHYVGPDALRLLGGEAPPADVTDRFLLTGRPKRPDIPLKRVERAYLEALYDGDLIAVDRAIGRLTAFLESTGRLDETLIVITADHGEHLMEVPGRLEHGGPWFDAVARIPLIVHYPPKIEGGSVTAPTEAVDVLPTVLALLDVPIPEEVALDGVDLLGASPPPSDPVFSRNGVRDEHFKLILSTPAEQLLGREPPDASRLQGSLYDLVEDPNEVHDLWSRHSRDGDIVRRLVAAHRERLLAPFARFRAARSHEQPSRPFAISVAHLEIDPAPARVQIASCAEGRSGWTVQPALAPSSMLASPGAEPVEVSVRIPNGAYHLTAAVRGTARLRSDAFENAADTDVVGPPLSWSTPAPELHEGFATVDLGGIRIVDEALAVRVVPAPDSCFLLRHFGFAPIVDGIPAEGPTDAERKRLRELGYVE